jgi:hypothetical protein
MIACRIELCNANGKILKSFGLDKCDGGPHEFRGVSRTALLKLLADALPADCIQYGRSVEEVIVDSTSGKLHTGERHVRMSQQQLASQQLADELHTCCYAAQQLLWCVSTMVPKCAAPLWWEQMVARAVWLNF